MKKLTPIIQNYKSSIILITCVLLGGFIGLKFPKQATTLQPIGELFLNLIFCMLIPMVFFSIASAITELGEGKNLSKLLGVTTIVFMSTAFISAIVGVIGFVIYNPVNGIDLGSFDLGAGSEIANTSLNFIDKIVQSVSVDDFSKLLSRENMLATIIFAILIGFATANSKEKGATFKNFLISANTVFSNVLSIIMKFAPIGLGCYFASTMATFGSTVANGFVNIFVLYCILTLICFVLLFTLYAFIANGKVGVKLFWQNIWEPSITALTTCSSAACIPTNIKAAQKMGVPKSIANIIMPIGVNMHKDGSVIGAVFKIMFVLTLSGQDILNAKMITTIILVSILVGAVVGAVPGGGAIGEMIILSVFGLSPETIAIMLIIATIIDAPATLLNSAGNTVCTMVISKFTNREQTNLTN